MAELIQTLTLEAPEEGTYPVTVAFFDEASVAVQPTSATWTLTNDRGEVINSRSTVALTGLSTTKTILVQNDDLVVGDYGIHRHLLVEYVYTSSLGSGLRGKSQVNFTIRNFTAVV